MTATGPQTTLQTIQSGARDITSVARYISRLADAFADTGNATVAMELDGYANQLINAANDILMAHATEVCERAAAADQASLNLLKVALATSKSQ
jgi:L-arabinose isomerase